MREQISKMVKTYAQLAAESQHVFMDDKARWALDALGYLIGRSELDNSPPGNSDAIPLVRLDFADPKDKVGAFNKVLALNQSVENALEVYRKDMKMNPNYELPYLQIG